MIGTLIDTLDRVLDKGVVIDAWVREDLAGIDLSVCRLLVVVLPNDDDDGGGGKTPAQQMRQRAVCG